MAWIAPALFIAFLCHRKALLRPYYAAPHTTSTVKYAIYYAILPS